MCIRDRGSFAKAQKKGQPFEEDGTSIGRLAVEGYVNLFLCLLYTSDAADERSSVDLGGRRIIKKKKHVEMWGVRIILILYMYLEVKMRV
mgnify:CR=1 FL=1